MGNSFQGYSHPREHVVTSALATTHAPEAITGSYALPPTAARPRYFRGAAMAILLVGVVLRAWSLGDASYWTDEMLTAIRAHEGLNESLESLFNSGNQGPLYFLSLRLLPNNTEALLRWPSVMLGAIGIALMMAVTLRLFGRGDLALWAGVLVATNPFHIWLSRMARPYPLQFVLGLLVSWCFVLIVQGTRRSRPVWIAFVGLSLLAYLTHYSSVALAAAQGLFLLLNWRTHRSLIVPWVWAQIAAGLPALLWMIRQAQQPLNIGGAWVPTPTLADVPRSLWSMTLGYEGVWSWAFLPGMIAVAAGLFLGVRRLLRWGRENALLTYWLWLILMPVLPALIVSQFATSFYVDRYFTVALPVLVLLLLCGWMSAPARAAYGALGLIAFTGLVTVLVSFHNGDYRRDDWRSVVAYLDQAMEPHDGLLIGRWNEREVFTHYAEQVNPALVTQLVTLGESSNTMKLEASSRRLWVLYRNPIEDVHRLTTMPAFDPLDPSLSPLGEWLYARRSRVIAHREFNGVTVLLLDPVNYPRSRGG